MSSDLPKMEQGSMVHILLRSSVVNDWIACVGHSVRYECFCLDTSTLRALTGSMVSPLCMQTHSTGSHAADKTLLAGRCAVKRPFTLHRLRQRFAATRHPASMDRQSARKKRVISSGVLPESTEVVIVGAGKPFTKVPSGDETLKEKQATYTC